MLINENNLRAVLNSHLQGETKLYMHETLIID
jgi:hypothetical protein